MAENTDPVRAHLSLASTLASSVTPQPQGLTSAQPSHQPDLDRPQNSNVQRSKSGIVQPKPQALARKSGPASIIVSPRQKGNPILNNIKSIPWEYGDTPADYILGLTTCALFLSLKYHRLHPEYVYSRIRGLQGKYALRIILCMVDIPNHEDALKELTKTSVINNVTIVLCWSAAEGGRYLELFKMYENAAPTAIKQHQSTAYSDRMVDFITTPRSVNKTDAVSLVSQFGSVRTAINARHEDVATIAGWGEKKVQQWYSSVREPFRVQQAGKRGIDLEAVMMSHTTSDIPQEQTELTDIVPTAKLNSIDTGSASEPALQVGDSLFVPEDTPAATPSSNAITSHALPIGLPPHSHKRKPDDDPLSEGVMTALHKLRKAE